MIHKLLKTKVGIALLSIIWGLGLATLFKKSCEGKNCKIIVYKGPATSEMKYHWQYDGSDSCYKWTPYLTPC